MKLKNKIVVEILGGLGNQLFQYAFLTALKKNNPNHEFYIDINRFNTVDDNKGYQLEDYFNLGLVPASKEIINELTDGVNLISRIKRKIFGLKSTFIVEKGRCFNDDYLVVNSDAYFKGLWQSELYFKDVRDEILEELKSGLNIDLDLKFEFPEKSVSLHVRRGDYYSNESYFKMLGGVCDVDYYKQALKLLESKIQDFNVIVFSDDTEWVKKEFKFLHDYNVVYSSNQKDIEGLILMSRCEHNIIANSTFSWWGAWLNQNPEKIIICPENWYADATQTDIIPGEWVRI